MLGGSAGRATGRAPPVNVLDGLGATGAVTRAAGAAGRATGAAGLTAAFGAAAFLAAGRFAVVFFAVARLAVTFLAPDRFAVLFFAVVRFAVDFLPPARLAVDRFAVDFFLLADFFFAGIFPPSDARRRLARGSGGMLIRCCSAIYSIGSPQRQALLQVRHQ
jgi:hypothetical protein